MTLMIKGLMWCCVCLSCVINKTPHAMFKYNGAFLIKPVFVILHGCLALTLIYRRYTSPVPNLNAL